MAHFAQIENNTVVRVLVVPDDQEHRGQDFLANDLGLGGIWIQTSYNNRIRKQFAGVGYTYNSTADVFISPSPYPSWILNENHDWEPPVPRPADANETTYWDEPSLSWVTPNDLPT
jgi:hypothetical protein